MVASTTETVVAALADNPDLANLQSDLVKATAEIQVTVDPEQGHHRRPHRGAGRERGPDRPRPDHGHPADHRGRQARRPHRPGRSRDGHLGRQPQDAPGRHGRQGPARRRRDGRAGRRPGQHHAHRPGAGLVHHRRDHQRRHGRRVPRGDRGDRQPQGVGRDPGRGHRHAGRRHAPSRPRPSVGCSPRWPSPSCSST